MTKPIPNPIHYPIPSHLLRPRKKAPSDRLLITRGQLLYYFLIDEEQLDQLIQDKKITPLKLEELGWTVFHLPHLITVLNKEFEGKKHKTN